MKYCVYVSKNIFDTETFIIKKMIKSKKDLGFDIDYKVLEDKKICYAFVKERDIKPCNFILKAMFYI